MLFVTSKDNSNVKKAVKLKSSAKERRKSGLFFSGGAKNLYGRSFQRC